MIEDVELLRRFRSGGAVAEAAFAELVRRYVDLVYSAAARRLGGDAHAAEDVTQQVFVALARRAGTIGDGTRLVGWLYGTTRNVAVDFIRAERSRRGREREAAMSGDLHVNETAVEGWERLRPLLEEVMDELGAGDREAVLLRFFARRPFAEIGRTLGVSEDAARMRVDRSLERLRGQLVRRGVRSTATALALALTHGAVTAAPAGVAASVAGAAMASASLGIAGASVAGSMNVVIQYISTSKIVVSGAVLVFAVATGSAVVDGTTAREAKVALAAARGDYAALLARERETGRRVAEMERSVENLKKRRDAARVAKPMDGVIEAMARNPELRRAWVDQIRARAASQYAGLFRELSLSPEQVERFKDLVAQGKSGEKMGPDGVAVAYHTGGDVAGAQWELHALLGEEGFKRFRDYESGMPAVQLTARVASALAETTAPLTAEQGERVRRLLMERRVPSENPARRRFDWPAIMTEAQRVLSAEQVVVFAAYRTQDELSEAMSELGRRRSQASAAGGAKKGGEQ